MFSIWSPKYHLLPVIYSKTLCCLFLSCSDEVTSTSQWSLAPLSLSTPTFSQTLITVSVFFYSSFSSIFALPPFLTHSLPLSSSLVFHCLARPLFRGSGSAGHWCAMSFSERSQEFSVSAEPPLSFCTPSPLFPLPQLLALCHCLSPAYCNPLTSHECWRLTASPKSESWNRWNMNGSLVYEKGVWVKEVV